jgi:hypothetical protein
MFDLAALEPAYGAWLRTAQSPLEIVYTSWMPMGEDAVRGTSSGIGVARVKDGVDPVLTMTHPIPEGSGLAGVLVGFDDPAHQVSVLLDERARLFSFVIDGDDVRWELIGQLETVPEMVRWRLDMRRDAAVLEVEGTLFEVPQDVTPAAGLAVYDDDIMFDSVRVGP